VKKRPFSVGEELVNVRDMEMSYRAIVIHEEDERGFISVMFADQMPRSLPVASLERPADRPGSKSQPRTGTEYSQAKNLGDYLTRVGLAESVIFTKEKE